MEQMKVCKVIPDVTFLNIFIRKRQFRRDYSGAQVGFCCVVNVTANSNYHFILIKFRFLCKEVLNYFQEYKLFPDIMTFGVLATGCHSLSEADALMKDMENAGFRF